MTKLNPLSRRQFVRGTAASAALGSASWLAARQAPAMSLAATRPQTPWGMQIGDVVSDRAIVWSRSDRPARMYVEWSAHENFRNSHVVRGPHALEVSDGTGRVDLRGLPAGEELFVQVHFEALDQSAASSEPLVGRFRTAPQGGRDIRFVWSGDTAGQGWGIDLDFGGMKIYETMREAQPDFFIHSGDNVYADGPLQPQVTDAAGNVIWRNAHLDAIPEKLKVAETLDEFRASYLYNRMDDNVRRFSQEVPQIWQWDDHEVVNNWSSSKVLDDRYVEKNVEVLVANATRAFLEHAPMRFHSQDESERVYRRIPYGRDLEVFVIDMRSYRAANGCNVEEKPGPETVLLGETQIRWLKKSLERSRATWKVIASDMPLGLVVGDGVDPDLGCPRAENMANGDGPVRGREHEIADILRFIKRQSVDNVVWLTADVHYCAAHRYHPNRAQFQDFDPFWEFVAGPLHAGSFGPNALDDTFGPEVVFEMAPPEGQANLPPSAGLQFFGQVDIDHRSKDMVVALKDLEGREVFSKRLRARRRR